MGEKHDDLDAENRATYATEESVGVYGARSGLQPGEARVLAQLGVDVAGQSLLDIGVGGGRTTSALEGVVGSYVGLDYVPELVSEARRRFPHARISQGDARSLDFEDGTFDVVLFSFNGIDGVGHQDRLRVLAEVRRVLRPGGLFWFSSHNRGWSRFHRLPWQGRPRLGRVMLKKSLEAWRSRANRRRLRPMEEVTDDYAIVNDEAHGYGLLLYYVDAASQVAQLERAGFTDVRVFDQTGEAAEPTAASPESIWMHYVSRS